MEYWRQLTNATQLIMYTRSEVFIAELWNVILKWMNGEKNIEIGSAKKL